MKRVCAPCSPVREREKKREGGRKREREREGGREKKREREGGRKRERDSCRKCRRAMRSLFSQSACVIIILIVVEKRKRTKYTSLESFLVI